MTTAPHPSAPAHTTARQNRPARRRWLACSAAALLALPAGSAWAQAAADEAAIRQRLMATFDKPEARLAVAPVVIVGEHAVAGWVQGPRGGRALMHKRAGQWQVMACGGDGIKQAAALQEAGMSASAARSLARGVEDAEARLSAAQRAQFNRFGRTVAMDAQGQHPPHLLPHGGHPSAAQAGHAGHAQHPAAPAAAASGAVAAAPGHKHPAH